MTKECPCSPREATLGASPRRRAAAGRGFFHPPAATEADGVGARRGAAGRGGEGTNLCFSFAFSFRVRDVDVRSASARERRREGGDGQTRARNRLDAGAKREKTKNKKQTRAAFVAVRTETNHRLRNDQGMPVFTPGSNPRRLPAAACRRGSWFLSSSREEQPRARGGGTLGNRQKKKCRCSFRGSSALRTSRPRRGTSRTCGPLSKRAPIAGVLRPLSQVTFCERAANETRVSRFCVSAFAFVRRGFREKNKREKRDAKTAARRRARARRAFRTRYS